MLHTPSAATAWASCLFAVDASNIQNVFYDFNTKCIHFTIRDITICILKDYVSYISLYMMLGIGRKVGTKKPARELVRYGFGRF
jgi:hypothetical protein